MIYKLTFDDGRIDWCTAENELHLLKSYDAEYDFNLQDIESLESITDDEAKTIMVKNTDFDDSSKDEMPDELCLYELGHGDDFAIIASTEFI